MDAIQAIRTRLEELHLSVSSSSSVTDATQIALSLSALLDDVDTSSGAFEAVNALIFVSRVPQSLLTFINRTVQSTYQADRPLQEARVIGYKLLSNWISRHGSRAIVDHVASLRKVLVSAFRYERAAANKVACLQPLRTLLELPQVGI
jgi:hypothetical protein